MGSRQHKNVEILREKEEKREEILKKDYGPKFKLKQCQRSERKDNKENLFLT